MDSSLSEFERVLNHHHDGEDEEGMIGHCIPLPPLITTPREERTHEHMLETVEEHQDDEESGRPEAPEEEEDVVDEYMDPPCKIKRWKKGQLLGKGAFGSVYLGLNLDTGELFAVKQMDDFDGSPNADKELAALENEIKMLKQCKHENIVQYLGCERSSSSSISIFLEYVSGGSICTLLERFANLEEPVVRVYTRQLLNGLEYLHSNGLAHRDIKGANVLITQTGIVKLADFGASKRIIGSSSARSTKMPSSSEYSNVSYGMKGTAMWMAPEVIREELNEMAWKKADIWSVGCTVIEMLTGRPPWHQFSNPVTAMYHIACGGNAPKIPEALSEIGKEFLQACFRQNPAERPSVSELLQFPFVRSGNGSNQVNQGKAESSSLSSSSSSTTKHVNKTTSNGVKLDRRVKNKVVRIPSGKRSGNLQDGVPPPKHVLPKIERSGKQQSRTKKFGSLTKQKRPSKFANKNVANAGRFNSENANIQGSSVSSSCDVDTQDHERRQQSFENNIRVISDPFEMVRDAVTSLAADRVQMSNDLLFDLQETPKTGMGSDTFSNEDGNGVMESSFDSVTMMKQPLQFPLRSISGGSSTSSRFEETLPQPIVSQVLDARFESKDHHTKSTGRFQFYQQRPPNVSSSPVYGKSPRSAQQTYSSASSGGDHLTTPKGTKLPESSYRLRGLLLTKRKTTS